MGIGTTGGAVTQDPNLDHKQAPQRRTDVGNVARAGPRRVEGVTSMTTCST